VGAVAVALGNMVGSLTVGKQKYTNVQSEILTLNQRSAELRRELLKLTDEDAAAFAPLAKAYAIPKDDPVRGDIIEEALKTAASVPLKIMRAAASAIDIIAEYAEKGSALAISDAGCGAALAKAALLSASLNVFINTKSMKNRGYAETVEKEADTLIDGYAKRADEVYLSIIGKIRG